MPPDPIPETAAEDLATTRAVIFDLDGVVRHWPGEDIAAIEQRHRLPPGTLFAEAFDPSLLLDAITGRCTDNGGESGWPTGSPTSTGWTVTPSSTRGPGHRRRSTPRSWT